MENTLKIGIRNTRNTDTEKRDKVNEVFKSVSITIKNKREFLYDIQIGDYKTLKGKFSKEVIVDFENSDKKACINPHEKIILFNDSFFKTTPISQQSVFIHEIGHIQNQPSKEAKNDEGNPLVKHVYAEYLADSYLFSIDKNIFLNGRVIPDISTTVDKIKKQIEVPNNKEYIAENIFVGIGRLYYFYSLCNYQPILSKIAELSDFIKKYYSNNIDLANHILKNLKDVGESLKSKNYRDLKSSFDSTYSDIINLELNQTNNS